MEGRSTVTNLVCITQFISEAIDRGSQVDVVYTDFSKAFDRLDHGLLMDKLSAFGLSSDFLELMKSYFTGRTQFVQISGVKSTEFAQTSGVPQGSILGPLLFTLFINDITSQLNVRYLLYADDIKIFSQIDNVFDAINLQRNLDFINSWCIANRLPLNSTKCNVMTFSRRCDQIQYEYSLNGFALQRPDLVKDLGVYFDPKLSFVKHIEIVVMNAYKSLGFIVRNMCNFMKIDTFCLLFNTFVRSKLEYASVVWTPIYATHIISIEKIQRRIL
jgi:Reverse transcriptase (RNA-dependent DNA polymerase).